MVNFNIDSLEIQALKVMCQILLECVPNLSEGRHVSALNVLYKQLQRISGLYLLDASSDIDHHRSVLTLVGPPRALEIGLQYIFQWSAQYIDLRQHQGVHPRLGAVDVIPLIPLQGITQAEAVSFSHALGQRLATEFQVPIYFYEHSATAPHRRNLADIRRGQYEGLEIKMQQPGWAPDCGPTQPHPALGASVLGVRNFLVAYNMIFTPVDLARVRQLARRLRASSGGLPGVKALGLWLPQRATAQLSVNLTDLQQTSLQTFIQTLHHEAQQLGLTPLAGEVIGLLPQSVIWPGYFEDLRLSGPAPILEQRLQALTAGQ